MMPGHWRSPDRDFCRLVIESKWLLVYLKIVLLQPFKSPVERTFAWLGRQRRLSKDYERLPEVSETVVLVAMIPLILNRLVS